MEAKEKKQYTIKVFDATIDYPTVCNWWDAQGWPSIPLIMLPKTGHVAQYEGKSVAAGWIYRSDAKITWMEWIVADPKADKEVKNECLNTVVKSLLSWADDNGFIGVMTSTDHKGLIKRYEALGFAIQQDGNMTNLIWSKE